MRHSTLSAHGLPGVQNTWATPASESDDEEMTLPDGWQLDVVDHRLMASRDFELSGGRVLAVSLHLPVMGTVEIEGLLRRVSAAVEGGAR